MRKILLAATGALLIAGTGALTVPASAATTCTGVLSGPVSGPVTVPAGVTCNIDNATVSGAVNVNPGGRFSAIHAASMQNVPEPQSGSTSAVAGFQPECRSNPAARASLSGAIVWIGR